MFAVRHLLLALSIGITISREFYVVAGSVPDFKRIITSFANVSADTDIDQIISKANITLLFKSPEFVNALKDVGFVHPNNLYILSTVELKNGKKAFDMKQLIRKLILSSDNQEPPTLLNNVLTMINLSMISRDIDYKKILSNDIVRGYLNLQGMIPQLILPLALQTMNINNVIEAVNVESFLKYSLTAKPNITTQQLILQNIDFSLMVKKLDLQNFLKSPVVVLSLQSLGLDPSFIEMLKGINFNKLSDAVNFNGLVAAAFEYKMEDQMAFFKDIIKNIDFKQLSNIGDINKMITGILNISQVSSSLKIAKINPDLLKSVLKYINLNDALKIIDFRKLFQSLSSLNGTLSNFKNLLKILQAVDLNKLLPDIKLRDILNIPKVKQLLNGTGINRELIVTIIESMDINAALKAFNMTGFSVFDTTNITLFLNKLIQSTNFNILLKSIDIDKLFAHPLVSDFVQEKLNMQPFILKMMLKSVDVDKLVKSLDTKKITDMFADFVANRQMEMYKKLINSIDFNKILQSINFDKFLNEKSIKQYLTKANVDPVIIEFLSFIMKSGVLKNLDVGNAIKQALLSNRTSFSDILKSMTQNVNIKKVVENIDWKKMIQKAGTGKLASGFLSTECLQDFVTLNFSSIAMSNLMHSQEVKMIDAWGKPTSRLLLGNAYWLGAYDECQMVSRAKYCVTQFKVANINMLNGMYGTCVPKHCTAEDVRRMVDILFSMTALFGQKDLFKIPVESMDKRMIEPVMCDEGKEYTTGFSVTLIICAIFIALCLLGTFVEHYSDSFNYVFLENDAIKPSREHNLEFTDISHSHSQTDLVRNVEEISETEQTRIPNQENPKQTHASVKFFTCFSLRKNIVDILSTDSPKGAIASINGIRTISLFWVIIGHMYGFFTGFPTDNILSTYQVIHSYPFQAILNAHVSVDTFFLISGMLVAYLTLKRMDKANGKINFFNFYVHRFLRITPVYMLVILLWTNVMPLITLGPVRILSMFDNYADPCKNYWWTNLLYINNFYPDKRMCLPWSWYLANDMQFYIIAPVILMAIFKLERKLRKSKLGAFLVTGLLCLISIIITGAIIGVYDLPAINGEAVVRGNPRSVRNDMYTRFVYRKPYTRITPYLIGILLGYILSRKMFYNKRYKKLFYVSGWLCAVLIGYSVVYGPWKIYKDPDNPKIFTAGEEVMYGAFFRLVWAVAVAWVIYACENNFGGFINSFLSWKAWIPLSRLTFGAYLLHPFVMGHLEGSKENPLHYQNAIWPYEVISVTFISFFASFVMAIFVESPLTNLEKMLLKRGV